MAPALIKSLSRLSRDSLVQLCFQWSQSQHSNPYLASNRILLESDEEDYLHEPAEDSEELKQLYQDLCLNNPASDRLSKRDIIDRIVDGDWRRGLSLYQLATIDFACLEQNDTAFRWTALRLVPLTRSEDGVIHPAKRRKVSTEVPNHPLYPQISPATFLTNLKAQISPLVKAHYSIHRLNSLSDMTILRLYITPDGVFGPKKSFIPKTPYEATDAARVLYIAIPDSCPFIYVSVSGNSRSLAASKTQTRASTKVDIATTKRIIFEAIPKAFSRPQERWTMQTTKMTAKSLRALCLLRGNGRKGTAGGAFSGFSDDYNNKGYSKGVDRQARKESEIEISQSSDRPVPTRIQLLTPPPEEVSELEADVYKRFGSMCGTMHASMNRFHVKMSNITSPPPYTLSDQKKPGGGRKRKRPSLEEIENGVETNPGEQNRTQGNNDSTPIGISLSFSGTDVFAGLKQLALLGSEYVDLQKMPAWVTGEKGVSALII